MEETYQTSLSAERFYPHLHLYSHRILWEIQDNAYSVVQLPSPAQRLTHPLFLVWVLRTPWCRKWDQPVSCTVLLPDHPSHPFFIFTYAPLCCLFTQWQILQTAIPYPWGGKRAENRMWIHPWLANILGETHAVLKAALTCLLDLLLACCFSAEEFHWNKRYLYWSQVNSVSALSLSLYMVGFRNNTCRMSLSNRAALCNDSLKNKTKKFGSQFWILALILLYYLLTQSHKRILYVSGFKDMLLHFVHYTASTGFAIFC